MRTNTASLRSVLSVDTRLFSPPTPNEKVARTSTRGWGKNKIQQCWQVCRPCRCPGGRNMWFVYENTQRRKSEEGKTKPAQPIGSRRWGCRMWVNQSASTLCESPLWASDRWLAWFRVFACYQRVIWSSNTAGYQNGHRGKKLNNVSTVTAILRRAAFRDPWQLFDRRDCVWRGFRKLNNLQVYNHSVKSRLDKAWMLT